MLHGQELAAHRGLPGLRRKDMSKLDFLNSDTVALAMPHIDEDGNRTKLWAVWLGDSYQLVEDAYQAATTARDLVDRGLATGAAFYLADGRLSSTIGLYKEATA
jgi:hypothetical protein